MFFFQARGLRGFPLVRFPRDDDGLPEGKGVPPPYDERTFPSGRETKRHTPFPFSVARYTLPFSLFYPFLKRPALAGSFATESSFSFLLSEDRLFLYSRTRSPEKDATEFFPSSALPLKDSQRFGEIPLYGLPRRFVLFEGEAPSFFRVTQMRPLPVLDVCATIRCAPPSLRVLLW